MPYGAGRGLRHRRLARRLAERGIETDALDASAEVIEAAVSAPRAEGEPVPNFRHADVTRAELPQGHYDFVSCLAGIHHVPFETVTALRDALAPGGTLVVLGCYPERSPADYAWALAAVPANALARAAVAVRERAAGAAHGRPALRAPVRPPEVPLAQIRQESARLLPGSSVRRLLFWRYLLVFRK